MATGTVQQQALTPLKDGNVNVGITQRMVLSLACLSVATFALALIVGSAAPAHAADITFEAVDSDSAVFDCPPPAGIYPEPDPCVTTPSPPELPEFNSPVDPVPVRPEWYCDPEAKPGVIEFRRTMRSTYGVSGSISRACDVTWSYEFSFHKMGLALDLRLDTTEPDEWAAGLSLIRWLLAPDEEDTDFAIARRIGVTELIWHNRVWNVSEPVWRIYCDPRDPSDRGCIANPTLRHDDHMHISFGLEAGYLHTSYFEALGFTPIPIPPPPDPLVDEELLLDEEPVPEGD